MSAHKTFPQETHSTINYADTTALERPARFPYAFHPLTLAIVGIACIIGVACFLFYNHNVLQAPARAKAAVKSVIAQNIPYNCPALTSYVSLSAEEIESDLNSKEVNYFPIENASANNSVITLFHNSTLISEAEAQSLNEAGVENLNSEDAAKLLYGSWDLTISTSEPSSIRLRYADFTSGSIDAALAKAISDQGLNAAQTQGSGIDESGNTYQTGVVEIEDEEYLWRVSALKLSDMYKTALSDSAVYVGIRIYQA